MPATVTAMALQDETLSALCWRVLGQTEGVVEQALAMNRGIAAQGPTLAEGQEVVLPNLTAPRVKQREMIQLWD
ncbi:tail protein X [Altererythrobacter sp. CC-YST694]|uniref:tail protein X n=1 Tax=Altererythrobacter sp. CC-YST694 TaxID=2755038 RepID=UPI001D00EAC5|nr:tail protein X [Altererythrobacter sp. CC-YST694]MCB5423977.1 tail protein X [Altererythrobacter sp. CC-YST694]